MSLLKISNILVLVIIESILTAKDRKTRKVCEFYSLEKKECIKSPGRNCVRIRTYRDNAIFDNAFDKSVCVLQSKISSLIQRDPVLVSQPLSRWFIYKTKFTASRGRSFENTFVRFDSRERDLSRNIVKRKEKRKKIQKMKRKKMIPSVSDFLIWKRFLISDDPLFVSFLVASIVGNKITFAFPLFHRMFPLSRFSVQFS